MSWLALVLERNAQRCGQRAAIVDGERRVTYRELDDRTWRLAKGMRAWGIEPGGRVAVLSRGRLEVLETYFALGKLGAVIVPLSAAATAGELTGVAGGCEVSAVIGEADLLPRVEGVPRTGRVAFEDGTYASWLTGRPARQPDVPLDALFAILHTSATTGRPKGVMVDARSIMSMGVGYLADARPPDGAVFLNCCPLYHGAFVMPLAHMAAGATIVLLRTFAPQACLAELERTRATHLWLVPEMLRFVLGARAFSRTDLTSLREVLYAAAPMPSGLIAEAHARMRCGFRQVYGLTEGGGPLATLAPGEHRFQPDGPPGPVGRAILGLRMRVCDRDGGAVEPGELGEVCIRGDGVMRGYWRDEEATRAAFRDGWLRTGDLGRMDERGYLTLAGRSKEVIIRGGQNVYPAEVEQALAEHPGVREAAVVGVPDVEWGEVPVAFVVARPPDPVSADDVLAFAWDRLPGHKRPARVTMVAELPRSPAGKILTSVLRERALAPE